MLKEWLAAHKAAVAEAERRMREITEAAGGAVEEDVGPELPDTHRNAAAGGNFGGFLRPGEGERCVYLAARLLLTRALRCWCRGVMQLAAPTA